MSQVFEWEASASKHFCAMNNSGYQTIQTSEKLQEEFFAAGGKAVNNDDQLHILLDHFWCLCAVMIPKVPKLDIAAISSLFASLMAVLSPTMTYYPACLAHLEHLFLWYIVPMNLVFQSEMWPWIEYHQAWDFHFEIFRDHSRYHQTARVHIIFPFFNVYFYVFKISCLIMHFAFRWTKRVLFLTLEPSVDTADCCMGCQDVFMFTFDLLSKVPSDTFMCNLIHLQACKRDAIWGCTVLVGSVVTTELARNRDS